MKVRRLFPLLSLLLGFLAVAAAPLAALPPAAEPACPTAALSLVLAPEAPLQPGAVPAPVPAAACPVNYCADQERLCLQGCPCGFLICDPVECWSNCVCPIFCPDES
jgi:hypothetical protein